LADLSCKAGLRAEILVTIPPAHSGKCRQSSKWLQSKEGGDRLKALNSLKVFGIAHLFPLLLCVGPAGSVEVWAQTSAPALTPVASIDVPRYMGTWYEVAKFPNRFQKQCVRNTQASYSLQADGTVRVVNRCTQSDGVSKEAEGAARQIGPATSPKLEVRFAPAWLSFLPWVWGNYWVIDLDANYQWVAVSEPRREFLWILSRTLQMEPVVYQALLVRLAANGFDVGKLEVSPQGN
jgi:apolipoprotein D and lipocalin family protein